MMDQRCTTISGIYPLRLREDLSRESALAYWAGAHADLVRLLPHLVEYNQYHFSPVDHGYWPATATLGTLTPASGRLDGLTELRFSSLRGLLRVPSHLREVFFDEQNVFDQVHGHLVGRGGRRSWTSGYDDTVDHRTVLLVRRRRGVSGRSFRAFVHEQLGPALHAAGARDTRTYTFLPGAATAHQTPGVYHLNPAHRRYHGTVIFGAGDRAEVDRLLASPEVAAAVGRQHVTCTAVHAFAVDRTVPVIRMRSE